MEMVPPASRETLRGRIGIGIAGPVFAAFAYATATTIFVAGLWRVDFLLVGACAWISARHLLRSFPRILILRRFGSRHTDQFIRMAGGGISGHFRPIWIVDLKSDAQLRHGLPGLWLYLARPFVWIVCGYFIASRPSLNAQTAALWITWMVFATLAYHRFACGLPSPRWIATLIAGATSFILLLATESEANPLQVRSWRHLSILVATFLAVRFVASILIYTIVPRTRLVRLFQARFIQKKRDLRDFVRELRGDSFRHRFAPLVPSQVSEIAATDEFWATAIYESIGASSVVIADVTGIERQAAIGWELEQALLAGAPLVLTCEEDAMDAAVSTLNALGLPVSPIFSWTPQDVVRSPSSAFSDKLSEFVYDAIKLHLAQDLSKLAPRHMLDQALARLSHWEKGQARSMS